MATIVVPGAAIATGAVPDSALDAAGPSTTVISIDDTRMTATGAAGGNPLWAIPLKNLSATRDRPIFSPSRRPPPPVVAINPVAQPAPRKPAEPERPQLTLVGTVAGDGEGYGIFLDLGTSAVLRIKTGQSHNGWTLVEIRGREAALKKGQKIFSLSLPVRSVETPKQRDEDEGNLTRTER